jgi:hypothetical protein
MIINCTFRKKIFIFLILLLISIQFTFKVVIVNGENSSPFKLSDLWGNWTLLYENDYGYNFKFYKDNKATVILYLNTNSIIFCGTYSIENDSTLKINLSEMKNEEKTKNLNLKKDFVKIESSYFVFKARITTESNKKIFELRPQKIFIDANDSKGYFEPFFKLKYTGQ